ncbi:hypothetical protein [Lignipirellula cremea]|uniref:Uncharacterized protein n=1 Tax=Lignipirellula cremea TaxID=2528010 RepID=A0A518DS82_9BACT|nr:hypothetical protein [Lignipirellula cremea]QDU94706.1 hypothetical protein Pla8534_25120 [Lignipirellula cremea]
MNLVKTRRGSLIVEGLVAMVIIGCALTVAGQLITLSIVQRRAVEEHAVACEEAANLAERISLLPYDQLEQTAAWELSDTARQLPHPQLKIERSPEDAAQRIRILILWRTDRPEPMHESLMLWRSRP